MSRSLGSSDLVQLPKLDALTAQVLGKEVMVAANGQRLPDAVAEVLGELASAHLALEGAVARRLPATSGPDPKRTRAADVALDATWSGLYDVVSGWAKMANRPQGAVAAGLLSKLFPDGVKFTQLPFKLEWAESSTRLLLIEQEALDDPLQTLGCGPVLRWIREAHKEYGDALGVTTIAEAETVTTTIRDALAAFIDALRDYVLRVAASVRKHDPRTSTLAEALLAPIQRWEDPGRALKLAPPPAPAPAPAAEPSHPQSVSPPAASGSPPNT